MKGIEMTRKKSAIIPYRFVKDQLQILLVTASSDRKRGRKWVIPKGEIVAPLKPHLSAIKEAYEEAGVLAGKPHPICVGKYRDSSKGEPIPTFLLEVAKLHKDWPEKYKRKRKWVNADKCEGYIKNSDLLSVINEGVRCVRSNGAYLKRAIATFCVGLDERFPKLRRS
ncbi:NUDIX hydrolase [candidate division KSB1 bacterium]|nr:NUDIX hydrolase [candidate division KSB1 bacterium]